jgi:hypothetical protein
MPIVDQERASEWHDQFRLGPVQDRVNRHRGIVSLPALELELKSQGGSGHYRVESVKRVEDVHDVVTVDLSARQGLEGGTEAALLGQEPSGRDAVGSIECGDLDPRESNPFAGLVLDAEVAVEV